MSDERYRAGDGRPETEREWRLIEKLVLSMQDEQRRQRRWSVFFRFATLAYMVLLLLILLPLRTGVPEPSKNEPHTAMVRISGIIAEDRDAGADKVASGLRRAFEAEHSKAVMLRINSPGGSPVQSAYVYREIKRLREKHPEKEVHAVITDVGASGAYYIAAAADRIHVDPSSILGSIGVIMGGFGFVDAIEKLGLERRMVTAGEDKDMLDPFAPLQDEHVEHAQQMLDQVHEQFIEAVREGRGDRLDTDNEKLFSGLVWTGEESIELGLADGFGSPGEVARDVIGEEDIVDYTVYPHPFMRFVRGAGVSIGEGIVRAMGLERWQLQ